MARKDRAEQRRDISGSLPGCTCEVHIARKTQQPFAPGIGAEVVDKLREALRKGFDEKVELRRDLGAEEPTDSTERRRAEQERRDRPPKLPVSASSDSPRGRGRAAGGPEGPSRTPASGHRKVARRRARPTTARTTSNRRCTNGRSACPACLGVSSGGLSI